jgi:hypothetical protein
LITEPQMRQELIESGYTILDTSQSRCMNDIEKKSFHYRMFDRVVSRNMYINIEWDLYDTTKQIPDQNNPSDHYSLIFYVHI